MAGTAVRGRLTWQVARVSSVASETDSVRTIELEVPAWPGHRAGQHLGVWWPAEPGWFRSGRSCGIASAVPVRLLYSARTLADVIYLRELDHYGDRTAGQLNADPQSAPGLDRLFRPGGCRDACGDRLAGQ